jgi:hypothetical protein
LTFVILEAKLTFNHDLDFALTKNKMGIGNEQTSARTATHC